MYKYLEDSLSYNLKVNIDSDDTYDKCCQLAL